MSKVVIMIMAVMRVCPSHVQGGADNPQGPFVWLHVESADNFKDPETARILTQQLYQFLEEELEFKKAEFFLHNQS